MRQSILLFIAASLLTAAVPLALVSPIISDTEGGTALAAGSTHVPGEAMFFSILVDGYKASTADKVHLTYKVDAFDPRGMPIVPAAEGEIEETLAPQDKHWKPVVKQEIAIPPLVASGTYKIVVAIKDLVGDATATKEVPFEVRGHAVESSDTLVIRNFHFYRSEQDTQPVEKAAYRPGNDLWARFDIIGFKYGEGNAIDVSYDVAAAAPGGKVVWSQTDAAVDQSQAFYPKRYVPGSMSLNLQKNIHPGEYAIVITAHDRIGKQTAETRQSFIIE